MVYKFDADGNGEVVAEAARSGIGSFLHLHYPHTDIPAQARALYQRNLFRIIADVKSVPVPVLPTLNERGQRLDLSLSVLRAVSPIHIEYLGNMGVGASLSISIVIEGKLWGLFACHHYSARCPGLERRSLSELFGQMFSLRNAAAGLGAAATRASTRSCVSIQPSMGISSSPSARRPATICNARLASPPSAASARRNTS